MLYSEELNNFIKGMVRRIVKGLRPLICHAQFPLQGPIRRRQGESAHWENGGDMDISYFLVFLCLDVIDTICMPSLI
jgi:hypothetical protein